MFITIQHATFNLNRISYISINKVNGNVIEVRTSDDSNNRHSFYYKDEEETIEAFKAINDKIYAQLALYGKR